MSYEQRGRPYYRSALSDIEIYDEKLRQTIDALQAERASLTELKRHLETADTRRCPFCGGTMRDLLPVIEFGGFAALSGDYLTLNWASQGNGWPTPIRWECESCLVHDYRAPLEDAQIWDNANPPSKAAFARVLFEAFPFVAEIAYNRGGMLWYLGTQDTWYAIVGNRATLKERWGI